MRRIASRIAVGAVAAWLAAPAGAEPLGPLAACVHEQLPAADRQAMVVSLVNEAPLSSAADSRFIAAQRTCVRRHAATAQMMDLAAAELVGTLYVEGLEPRLRAARLPVEALGAWFDALSEDNRARLALIIGGPTPDASLGRSLLDALDAAGVRIPIRPGQQRLVSRYLSARMMQFRAQRGLPMLEPPS